MSLLHYRSYRTVAHLARDLRKNQTQYEKLLWKLLRRKNHSGYKFLRQHPVFYHENKGWVDFYVADFYCNKLKLIIELDGGIHDFQKEYDKDRDEKLASKGLFVVRLANKETEDLKSLEILLNQLIEKRKIQINSRL